VSQRTSGTFAGLIDGTFGLLRRTWKTTLACGGIAFLPVAALYGWAYSRLFDVYASILPAAAAEDAPLSSVFAVVTAFAWILLAALVQGLAMLFVRSRVTARAASAVRGRDTAVPAPTGRVIGQDVTRLLGQRILQGLVYAGVLLAVAAALAIVVTIVVAITGGFGGSDDTTALTFGVVLLAYLVAFAVWIVLWVRFSLTLETMVIDGSRARRSFALSASLVRGGWWRVFGYRFLFALMLGFAASLIATPIVFFATIRAYARYLAEMVRGTADAGSLVDMLRTMGSGLPVRLAIFLYLSSLLRAFFAPVFMTLLYFAMKQRKAEDSRRAGS
jgi:hypothetical protein